MLVKSAFGYTVLLILLTTVIFIFIDDFTYTLNPLLNEMKNEKKNYNLPKALGIAFVITIIFIILKEKVLKENVLNVSNIKVNNIKGKKMNNIKLNNNNINNNVNNILKLLKK